MTITIQGRQTCAGGEHITLVTDRGNFSVSRSDMRLALPDDPDDKREILLRIIKHQYLSRLAAGRTEAQALNDLNGFVVRQ